jgi:hypothetical protein
MHDGWEMVESRKTREKKAARVYVSLNKRGEIAMNAEAFRRINEPANVTLLYYEKERCVGVKYPRAADGNFFPVRRYGRGRKMRIVRARRMLEQFGIKLERTLVFSNVQTQLWGRDPMLVLELGTLVER